MDLKRIIYLHFPTYIKVKTKANVKSPTRYTVCTYTKRTVAAQVLVKNCHSELHEIQQTVQ
jgi:hypothetical protein